MVVCGSVVDVGKDEGSGAVAAVMAGVGSVAMVGHGLVLFSERKCALFAASGLGRERRALLGFNSLCYGGNTVMSVEWVLYEV